MCEGEGQGGGEGGLKWLEVGMGWGGVTYHSHGSTHLWLVWGGILLFGACTRVGAWARARMSETARAD